MHEEQSKCMAIIMLGHALALQWNASSGHWMNNVSTLKYAVVQLMFLQNDYTE